MACNTCQSLDSISECSDTIELGIIDPDLEVYIYVKNIHSGYIHRQEAVSDNTGLLILDLSNPDVSFYNQNSAYEVWVTLQTDSTRLVFIDPATFDCLNPSFYKAMDI